MRKKIIFVDHTSRIGGAQLSLLDIADNFKNESSVLLFGHGEFEDILIGSGVETLVLDLDKALYPLKRDVKFFSLVKALPNVLRRFCLLRKQLSPYDIIYANSFKSFVISTMSTIGLKRKRVLHLRDALSEENFSKVIIKSVTILSKCFKVNVIANSNYTKECFIKCGGDEKRCDVIWNGVDDRLFIDTPEIDYNRENINILSLGRISPWKGQHIVIEAIKNVPSAILRIVGSPNFGEDDYYESLKKLVEKHGLGDRVFFHEFSLNIEEHLSWSDVFVHSSTSPEPFGRVIVEAMLAGRIVIATDSGGVPEIVSKSDVGILIPPDDIVSLEKAINSVISNKKHYMDVALNGKLHAKKFFTLQPLFENLKNFFGRI